MALYSTYKPGVSKITAGVGIAVTTSTGNIVISNTGVLGITFDGITTATGTINLSTSVVSSISSGTDFSVNTSTGNVIPSVTSTLDSVTSRGNTTNNIIILGNSAEASSTATGVLQVVGGVGIGGSLYATDIYSNGAQVITTSTLNSAFFENPEITTGLYVNSNPLDPLNSSTITLSSSAPVGYSALTIQNTGTLGRSYTVEVGGNNHALTNGESVNEGNLTIYDNVDSEYRMVITKAGNMLVGGTTDSGQTLQVSGDISSTGSVIINTSLLETRITLVNTDSTTVVDSFEAEMYRTSKSLIQIQDGIDFQLSEIVLLHDTLGQVYKSEYGIISTSGEIGTFTADLQLDGIVRLYFTANNASDKVIKIVKTAIAI